MKTLPTALLAAALAATPAGLAAQADSAHAPPPRALCFKGAPRDTCRAFLLTEFSRSAAEYGTGQGSGHKNQVELGAMANLDAANAVGASLFTGLETSAHRGVSLRYRRWLNRAIAVDLAPGVMSTGSRFEGRESRFTGQATLSVADYVGIFVRGEAGDTGRVSGGVRLGASPGLIVGIVAGLISAAVPET